MAYQPLTPEQFQKAQSAGFSTDQIIQFEQKRKQESNTPTITGPTGGGVLGTVAKGITDFGVGAGTAIGKGLLAIPQAAAKGVGTIAGVTGGPQGSKFWNDVAGGIGKASSAMYDQPQFQASRATLPGVAGTVAGNVALYAAPAGKIAEGTNAASGLAANVPGTAGALYRTFAGMTAEAAQNYILGYALSGGDVKQAAIQGATAGLLKGATAGVGEALKGTGVDEKLMGKIYSSSKADTSAMLFGSKDTSLAQEAIGRGITGNAQNQAVQIQKGLSGAEAQIAQEFEAAGNPTIQLDSPTRYIKAITARADLLDAGGATNEAQSLRASLSNISSDGTMTVNSALGLRRFLDGLRQVKSFLTPTEELQTGQAGLKEMSDALRSQINSIGETSAAMKDYQFYINAKNALINYAKSSNSGLRDFFGKLLFAESIFSHTPAGLSVAAYKGLTGAVPATAAQVINRLPSSGETGTALRSVTGAALGGLSGNPSSP